MSEIKLIDRSTLDKKYLWNAESVFPDRGAWRSELEAVKAAIPDLASRAGIIAAAATGAADRRRMSVPRKWRKSSASSSKSSRAPRTSTTCSSMPT